MEKFLKSILLSYLLILIKSSHDSFKNECGPYSGLDDEVIMPKKEDCIGSSATSPLKCCFLEGEKDLIKRTACVLIEDNADSRIELIQELSEIATKLKVDCGTSKSFTSDCGSDNPSSEEDCSGGSSGKKCCFVKITSPQFTGQACRQFDSIDINTIGEAVVAAKTVNAELDVKCNYIYLNMNYYLFVLFLLYLL
jgi:hypothetical protein